MGKASVDVTVRDPRPFVEALRALDKVATPGPLERDGARGLPWTVEKDHPWEAMRAVAEFSSRFPGMPLAASHTEEDCANAALFVLLRNSASRIADLCEAVASYKSAWDRLAERGHDASDDAACEAAGASYERMVAALAALDTPS